MTGNVAETSGPVKRWWFWFGVALFFLIPLDLFTTLLAVAKYGTAVEANPIMRWLLEQGLFAVTAVNLVVIAFAVILFQAAIGSFERVRPSYRRSLASLMNIWIGFLIVSGVVLVTNNLLLLV